MSRLSIDISSEQHQRIKSLAALEGKSIKAFVLERLFENKIKTTVNDEDAAWEELNAFLK